ncbi:hypothetical protein G6F40_016337 [Rhizopus arrhizus]|nr:hypothetical protein G6F40_016337 [Rhizopus arrhizus]
MAAAVAMRLVPPALLPRALSIIFSGIAVGTVVAVPLGSYLGGSGSRCRGWRRASRHGLERFWMYCCARESPSECWGVCLPIPAISHSSPTSGRSWKARRASARTASR